jgi:hypothetical protein
MRYWMVDSQRAPQGPFERSEVERRILAERVEPSRLVCPEGGQAWVTAAEAFPALFARPAERSGTVAPTSDEPFRVQGAPKVAPPPPPRQPQFTPAPAAGGDRALGYFVPVGVEPFSLAAGYLGLLSLAGGCLGPISVVVSIIGFVRLRKQPGQRGHVRCAIGLVGGLLGSVMLALIIVASASR